MPLLLLACRSESISSSSPPAGSAAPPAASAQDGAEGPATDVLPASVTVSTEIPKAIGFERYENKRFQYTLDYPTFVKIEPPVEGETSQSFTYFDRVHIHVRAAAASASEPLDDLYRAATAPRGDSARVVTAKSRSTDSFIVEGTQGPRGFYQRVLRSDESVVTLSIDYELASKEKFAKAVKHVGDSLHFGVARKVPAGAIPASVP